MCNKDQVMNIPFLLQFCQKQLPASVPDVWAVCWKGVWTEPVQPWATFLHPAGTGPAPGPALAHQTPRWGRKWYQRCFFTTYLLLFVRYCLGTVTATLHTPNQNPGGPWRVILSVSAQLPAEHVREGGERLGVAALQNREVRLEATIFAQPLIKLLWTLAFASARSLQSTCLTATANLIMLLTLKKSFMVHPYLQK